MPNKSMESKARVFLWLGMITPAAAVRASCGGATKVQAKSPKLQLQVKEDDAAVKNTEAQIPHAQEELNRVQAQQKVLQLQYEKLNGVAQSKPGLVAQQEVDDSQGKALASAAQVKSAKSNLQSVQSVLAAAEAKREHDQALFDHAKITAPFAGVVTQRYANLGTLLQAGTNSSKQALPLVKLSQDDVRFIHLEDSVGVNVPSPSRTFLGKVARFSVDVREDTRTMHTEVDVKTMADVVLVVVSDRSGLKPSQAVQPKVTDLMPYQSVEEKP